MPLRTLAGLTLSAMLVLPAAAWARCDLFNDTAWDFTVESGNVSNQRVGPRTHTSIAPGAIRATSKDGKSFGGSCCDGDKLVVVNDRGVPVLKVN
jgi:hypothetical protein